MSMSEPAPAPDVETEVSVSESDIFYVAQQCPDGTTRDQIISSLIEAKHNIVHAISILWKVPMMTKHEAQRAMTELDKVREIADSHDLEVEKKWTS